MVKSATFTAIESGYQEGEDGCMDRVYADRRWLRLSLDRPCYVAQMALWIGAHDRATSALCLVLMLIALAWG